VRTNVCTFPLGRMKSEKEIRWDEAKDAWLQSTRGISFVEVSQELRSGRFWRFTNPRGQPAYVVWLGGYPVVVPTVETGSEIFLKTAFPSRKWKRKLRREDG
jgi:hypothetical protein